MPVDDVPVDDVPAGGLPAAGPGEVRSFSALVRRAARAAGQELDEARLDEVCRPERYLDRLAPVFERLAALA